MTYKRSILVSGFDASIRMRNRQLLICDGKEQRGSIPLDEVDILVIDTPLTMLTNAAVVELAAEGGVIALCDSKHIPGALVLPIEGHCLHAQRLRLQMEVSTPTKKRIWQQLIQAKVINQADALRGLQKEKPATKLETLSKTVLSGDTTNVEAQAAQLYWREWLSEEMPDFNRDPDGEPPNLLLNYGYAILRAAVARAIVTVGLHPAVGLFHHNKTNAFALADDVMEPFRPFVDTTVHELYTKHNISTLDQKAKATLINVLHIACQCDGHRSSILNAINHLCDSIILMMMGRTNKLSVPSKSTDETIISTEEENE